MVVMVKTWQASIRLRLSIHPVPVFVGPNRIAVIPLFDNRGPLAGYVGELYPATF